MDIDDKKFLCSKNLNFLNQKIGVIPDGEQVIEFLEQLQQEFKPFDEVKSFFQKSVELKLFFNQLITGVFFVFKLRPRDEFIFHPKHSRALNDINSFSFKKSSRKNEKTFLRRVETKWEIDSASSSFFVRSLDGFQNVGDLPGGFLECLDLDLLNCNENKNLDFKDELFLYNLRRRSDLTKGTLKNPNNIEIKGLERFFGSAIESLNLFKLPSLFRRNSSRKNAQIPKQAFLSLLEDIFSIQAVLKDPYFGRINKKNFPSAGSGYGLIPVIYVNNVAGIKKGVYSIDEEKQCLVEMQVPPTHFQVSMQSFRSSWGVVNGFPSAAIQFIFSPSFYYQKYNQTCLALNLLNGGVLISEVYRYAQVQGLGACALGGIYEDLWSEITDGEFFSLCEINLTA